MKKKLLAAVTAAVMGLGLVSCSGDKVVKDQVEPVTVSLSWWGNDSRNEYTLAAVSKFEELHPDIKVKCSYSEWSGYEARSRVQMISGTEADVMQINVGWLRQYSADGSGYYDLDKLSDVIQMSNFSEETLSYGRKNGVLNAIPIAMNTETVYFNKTVYDKFGLSLPKTWDELFAAAKVLSADGIYPLSGASKSIWLYCIAYAEQKNGKHIFGDNDELNFNADDLKLMIEFYCRLVNEKVIPKCEDFQKFEIDNGVYAGLVAWVSDALNYFKKSIEEGKEIVAADYTAFTPEESGAGWYAKPATLYAVSKNTEHPKEAAMLLDFMLNSSEWAEFQGIEKGIPISSSARAYLEQTGVLKGLQYEASQVMEKNRRISEMNSLVESSELYEGFISACDMVLFDKADTETAARQLYESFTKNKTDKNA